MSYKFINRCLFILAMFAMFLPTLTSAATSQFGDVGAPLPRIEQEDKLYVPADKIDEVWDFLYSHYVEDEAALKELDPLFTSYTDQENFSDTYFDTSDLDFLKKKFGIRHRWRSNLTNPEDAKSGRELVQIKVSAITDNPLDRGEFKYEVRSQINYKIPEDNHPLLSLLKYADREDFKKRVEKLGIANPYDLKPILVVNDWRRRVYFNKGDKPFFSFSLDLVTSEAFGVKVGFVEVEDELNEVTYTEADEATRHYMQSIRIKTRNEILAKFPYIKEDLTPKYNKSFDRLENKIPFFRFWLKYNPYTIISGAIVVIILIVVIMVAVIGRIIKKRSQKK